MADGEWSYFFEVMYNVKYILLNDYFILLVCISTIIKKAAI